jgi:membrane associated rhomboid family serine protease
VTAPPASPPPPSSPPRPIYTPAADDGRIVPPGWLDQAPVTRLLLALNICVFVAETVISRSASNLPTAQMLALGASYSLATVGEGRVETLVTACFLHAGLVHLAFNMIALWQAGPLVERAVGSARMAPMYLLAGVFGNLLSVLYGWYGGTGGMTVGASGAISGVIAAALVVGWRTGGWQSPLTQAMARWLGFVVIFGIVSNLSGGNIDNAAHVGGAVAGAAIAALWKRGYRYSSAATAGILGACGALLLACIATLAIRDRTDRFATMELQARVEFTADAVSDGRCGDAKEGLAAVERLRPRVETGHPAGQVREEVEETCGRQPLRAP